MNQQALWYQSLDEDTVQCTLCPHLCNLKAGKTGICRVRTNIDGKLITEVNGFVSSIRFDPIEKKPLYHFYPGTSILSIGTYGCNLRCFFCQNCSISQTGVKAELPQTFYTPAQIVDMAVKKPANTGIAFTYNEPIVWFEYMYDIARLAKKAGLKTVMVTNGFINAEPLKALIEHIDAFSIDLKAFNEEFYSKVTSSKLEPVKEALKQISRAGKHLEIVNLVIPELNDDDSSFKDMVKWISSELGKETVFQISRYFPHYKLSTAETPISVMRHLKQIAERELTYVYSGNIYAESSETRCIMCHNVLITRSSYTISTPGIDDLGKCKVCGNDFLKKT